MKSIAAVALTFALAFPAWADEPAPVQSPTPRPNTATTSSVETAPRTLAEAEMDRITAGVTFTHRYEFGFEARARTPDAPVFGTDVSLQRRNNPSGAAGVGGQP